MWKTQQIRSEPRRGLHTRNHHPITNHLQLHPTPASRDASRQHTDSFLLQLLKKTNNHKGSGNDGGGGGHTRPLKIVFHSFIHSVFNDAQRQIYKRPHCII